ncbi:MAG: BREX system P-loop protein BrxC [Cyanobacteria bacterium MAG CAR1_bin_15]|nr:BREX system P-loop protein BrxC [Cyanobacteria bacterium MAG CAR1_bin_15]
MQIVQSLQRDPRTSPLANNGQARITTRNDENAYEELRAELTSFVCDGQYGDAIQRILQSYLDHQNRPRQNAAWISGFFGSGKSHLQKMLGHLWANTDLGNGQSARNLVVELPEDVKNQFQELDILARRSGLPLTAASGAMPAGNREAVRATVLAVLLRTRGWPEKVPQAKFCFWLQDQGYLQAVRASVEAQSPSGNWLQELQHLYVNRHIAQALLKQDPDFAADQGKVREVIREQFPQLNSSDISTREFVELARKALAPQGGELPHTVLVLDEVQQYIGDSNDRATAFVELAEAIQTEMDSRVLLVASGQSALSSETPQLQKLKDRFRVNVQLSDADVETVIRKVILQKRADAQATVQQVLDANAGEISKQLQDTAVRERSEDRQVMATDYPLLPTRWRFWEACFRAVDPAGTNSQLRSQLRIIFDAVKDIAEQPLGQVVTANVLFQAMGPDLVSSGVLFNELHNRIAKLADGSEDGRLKQGLCSLAFLISRLPRERGVDQGIRATARTLADLMVADIRADSGPLRQKVEQLLETMANDGTLMRVGQPGQEEYRLQTTEGAQWQSRLNEKHQEVRNDEPAIASIRHNLLLEVVDKEIDKIKLMQGEARVSRKLKRWSSDEPPADEDEKLVVWLRDGWGCSEEDVRCAARAAGSDDPVIHVFLPKPSGQDLREQIIAAEAAKRVIDHYGAPTTDGGREARLSMESRQDRAEQERNACIDNVIRNALVFKGGGTECEGNGLMAKIQDAAEAGLVRLFSEFGKADHTNWGNAVKRAREGSDTPLEVVGHRGCNDAHPVAQQALTTIGANSDGRAIRRQLCAAPYGWPQDAVDAVLLALHGDGTLCCTLEHQPVAAGRLDQRSLGKAIFAPQQVRLTSRDKIAVRSVFRIANLSARPGEEESKAREFLDAVDAKIRSAGGELPLPPAERILASTRLLQQLRDLSGPEQLQKILEAQSEIKELWDTACSLAEKKEKRWPRWERLQALLRQARDLEVYGEVQPQVQAIQEERRLLDDTDYVEPLLQQLEQALAKALAQVQQKFQQMQGEQWGQLEQASIWQNLSEGQQRTIIKEQQLASAATTESVRSDLQTDLEQRSLASWAELTDSLPARFQKARAAAAKTLEPTTQPVKLSSDVLKDEAALDAWWADQRQALLSKFQDGPIQIH